MGVSKVNVGGCEPGYSKVKVGQCNSVNGTETGVKLPSSLVLCLWESWASFIQCFFKQVVSFLVSRFHVVLYAYNLTIKFQVSYVCCQIKAQMFDRDFEIESFRSRLGGVVFTSPSFFFFLKSPISSSSML